MGKRRDEAQAENVRKYPAGYVPPLTRDNFVKIVARLSGFQLSLKYHLDSMPNNAWLDEAKRLNDRIATDCIVPIEQADFEVK